MRVAGIETLYRRWLDICLAYQIFAELPLAEEAKASIEAKGERLFSNAHVWQNARLLPRRILQDKGDWQKINDAFLPKNLATASMSRCAQLMPIALTAWSWESRRAYNLRRDLQDVLENTALESQQWSDDLLPFPVFAVGLAKPIQVGCKSYTSIVLVNLLDGDTNEKICMIYLINDSYVPIGPESASRLRKRMRDKKLAFATSQSEHQRILGSESTIDLITFGAQGTFAAILKMVGDSETRIILQKALRIAVGLGFYLGTLPIDSCHVRRSLPHAKRGDTNPARSITDEAMVFDVYSNIETMPTQEASVSEDATATPGRPHGSPSPHWREAYWRRPWGKGNDPDAPRSVRIPRVHVLREKLSPQELPIGAAKTI